MGFTPRQIDEMSLWEFNQTCAGWEKFYCGSGEDENQSYATKDELMEMFAVNEAASSSERIAYKPKS